MAFDAIRDLRLAIKERAGNPYVGSFILVLAVRFWKVPAALLAERPHAALHQAIEAYSKSTGICDLAFIALVVTPLAAILPLALGVAVSWLSGAFKRGLVDIDKQTREGVLLSREESRAVREANHKLIMEAENALQLYEEEKANHAETVKTLEELSARLAGESEGPDVGELDQKRAFALLDSLPPDELGVVTQMTRDPNRRYVEEGETPNAIWALRRKKHYRLVSSKPKDQHIYLQGKVRPLRADVVGRAPSGLRRLSSTRTSCPWGRVGVRRTALLWATRPPSMRRILKTALEYGLIESLPIIGRHWPKTGWVAEESRPWWTTEEEARALGVPSSPRDPGSAVHRYPVQ